MRALRGGSRRRVRLRPFVATGTLTWARRGGSSGGAFLADHLRVATAVDGAVVAVRSRVPVTVRGQVLVRPAITGPGSAPGLTRVAVPAAVWVLPRRFTRSGEAARHRLCGLCGPRPAGSSRPTGRPIETRRPLIAVLAREAERAGVASWSGQAVRVTVAVRARLSSRSRLAHRSRVAVLSGVAVRPWATHRVTVARPAGVAAGRRPPCRRTTGTVLACRSTGGTETGARPVPGLARRDVARLPRSRTGSRPRRAEIGWATARNARALTRISRVPHGGTEFIARNRSVARGDARCAIRRVFLCTARCGKTTVPGECPLTGKAVGAGEFGRHRRTVEGSLRSRRREDTRSGRRTVTRHGTAGPAVASKLVRPTRPTLIVAVWRVDQAAWCEDRRRREHPVAVMSGLAPAIRWPPSLALPPVTLFHALPGQFRGPRHRAITTPVLRSPLPPIGAPGTRLRPAITRSPCAGSAAGTARDKGAVRGKASVRGKEPVWARTGLALRSRPAIELAVAELARQNRSGRRHPAWHILTGAGLTRIVLIRRNRSGHHRTRCRRPRGERARSLRPLPVRGRPGTLLPGIRLRLTCPHGAGPAPTMSMRSADVRFWWVLPGLVRTRWVLPGWI